MAYVKIPQKPGVFKDQSPLIAEGVYVDADHVRWRNGNAETTKGFESTGGDIIGVCRGIHVYADNSANIWAALGTHLRLYVMDKDGVKYDITPVIESSTLTSAFTSSVGSAVITVRDDGHGLSVDQKISFTSANTVGGVSIQGAWTVLEVLSTSAYTFTASSVATGTSAGVGTAWVFKYYLAPGQVDGLAGTGYGVGGYGLGGYGTPNTDYDLFPRTWKLDHWGQNLIAIPRGGNVFEWASSVATEASVISSAPTSVIGGFVTPERMMVVYGCDDDSGNYDPMLVRWCDQENNRDWVSSAANTAGSFRLANGTRIVGGLSVGLESLIWTDVATYRMRFVPDLNVVYAFDKIGDAGLLGPNAAVTINGRTYWITPQKQFMEYTGGVPTPIPNPSQKDFADNLALAQQDKVYAFTLGFENEVWWLYPDARDGVECSRYQIVDYAEGWWSVGTYDRTAWADAGVLPFPLATSTAGGVFYQEKGFTSGGGNLTASLVSAFADLGDGDVQYIINNMKPDFYQMQGGATITLQGKYNPQSVTTYTNGPFNINASTERVNMRMQAAQIQYTISSDSSPLFWQLGAMSFDTIPTTIGR
jgi:hypothetical protein